MSIYIDADVFVAWEKGEFDLIAWLEKHSQPVKLPCGGDGIAHFILAVDEDRSGRNGGPDRC